MYCQGDGGAKGQCEPFLRPKREEIQATPAMDQLSSLKRFYWNGHLSSDDADGWFAINHRRLYATTLITLSFHTIARLPMESHMEDNRD